MGLEYCCRVLSCDKRKLASWAALRGTRDLASAGEAREMVTVAVAIVAQGGKRASEGGVIDDGAR